jgi:membrane carboxypeptidase/penicillin-binding protein PbpC
VLVGAWVGNNDNTSMKTVASGISGATPIWQRIMLLALKSGFGDPEFVKPDNVEQAEVDLISGYPAHDEFPKRFEWVKRGTLPDSPDPIHAKLRLCPGENKLATDAKIVSGDYEKKEFIILEEHDPYSEDGRNRWQESVDAWRNEQADSRYRPPTEYCGDQTEVFVRLDKPEDKENYEDTKIEIKVRADAGSGIEKMEIIVDGKVWETINDNRYEGDIKLKRGRYTIWVKAYSRDGEETESDKKRIGVGGETWNEPTPTQVPPTSTPAPKPTSVPSPTTEVIKPPIKPSATPIPILTLQPTEPPTEKD